MHPPFSPSEYLSISVSAPVAAVACLAVGALFLIFGWKLHRLMLMLFGALLGGVVGVLIASRYGYAPLHVAAPLAIVMGVAMLLLEKFGAFIAGGVCAAAPVFVVLSFQEYGDTLFVLAGIAFLIGGLLTLLLWRPLIILIYGLIGGALMVNGALIAVEVIRPGKGERIVEDYGLWLAVVVAALALAGGWIQGGGSEGGSDGND